MVRKLIVVMVLMALPLFAQESTQQNPSPGTTPGAMPQHHHKSAGMQSSGDMHAMHEKHMQEMKQNIAKMKALLQEMKTNAAGLSGKEKAAMDANVQLWQMMIDHMEEMMNNMSMMGSMDMHGGMMGHQGGAMDKQTTPPPK